MFPLKKIWDWWIERQWTAFWLAFKAAFKSTESGKKWVAAFYEGRAKADIEAVKEHPELAEMLHCKQCQGKGCDNCGGTGWD